MTIFGKMIAGVALLFIGTGVYYAVTSYVKEDSNVALVQKEPQQEPMTTQETSLLSATTTASTTEQVATTSKTATTDKSGKKIPFTDIMNKGGSYKCTVTQKMANMVSDGTVYIHDKLIKVEFATTLSGQSMSTTMVARDGYFYSWTSMMPNKGYKIKIVEPNTKNTASSTGTYTWNGSQIVDYSCVAWSADDSVFELPKTTIFTIQ